VNASTRLEIVLYTQGLEFDEAKALHGPLGGSETALGLLARSLAKRGHKVRVFCETKARGTADKAYGGVEYCHWRLWPKMAQILRPDVLVISRSLQALAMPFWPDTGMTYLWLHDIMTTDYERLMFSAMAQLDKVVVNSDYALAQVRDASHGFKDFEEEARRQGRELVSIQPLGIPMELLPKEKQKRQKKLLLYSSRSERGLDTALKVMDKLNEDQKPGQGYRLVISGYDVPSNLIDEGTAQLYAQLKKHISQRKDVALLDAESRTREGLYKTMAQCDALLYPTDFPEIFCLTVLEAQACGLPVITTEDYAMRTTSPGAVFIDGYPEDGEKFVAAAANAVRGVCENDIYRAQVVKRQNENPLIADWDKVAENWEAMFMDDFTGRLKRDPVAVARGLYKDSDLVACKQLLEDKDIMASVSGQRVQEGAELLDKVRKEIAFLKSAEAYRDQYQDAENGRLNEDAVKNRGSNGRIKDVIKMLGDMKLPPHAKILDYGCNLGFMTLSIKEAFPGAQVIGYDVDADIIKRAGEICGEEAKRAEIKEPPTFTAEDPGQAFDAIVCAEVLEHVPDTKAFLEGEIYPRLLKTGVVLVTVPSGPWEFNSFDNDPRRFHVRRYRNIDLEDMINQDGAKSYSQASPGGFGKEHNPLGWLMGAWQPVTGNVEQFNYDRHILTQRPRQTVSCCMITRDRSWELIRMADSVRPYVDELIVCDTGTTSPEALAAQDAIATKQTKGPDPLVVGFAAARNYSVKDAKGDWIFWIDSDEWLDHPERLREVCRENPMRGYNVAQKHLTLDGAHAEPDSPMRLYRRDCGAQFFGLIHEQLEQTLDESPKPAAILPETCVLHDSYYAEEKRQARFNRNLPLLLREAKELPDRKLTKVLLIRDYVQYGVHLINNGLTAGGRANILKAIELYEKHVEPELHKGRYFKHGFRYYQEGLRALRIGIGVTWGVACKPGPIDERETEGIMSQSLVFRTAAEAQRYINAVLKDGLEGVEKRLNGPKIYHARPGSR